MYAKYKIKQLAASTACPALNYLYRKSDTAAHWLYKHRISPNLITLTGLLFALLGLNFLAMDSYFVAFLCLLGNRICDILDGMVARIKGITAFGAFFDTFADYTSAALFIWGFIMANTSNNAPAAGFLMFSLLVSATSLLGYAMVSRQSYYKLNKSKIKICLWGNIQNLDTYTGLSIMCLLPSYFIPIAIFFGLLSVGKSLLIISSAYYHLSIATKVNNKNVL